MRRSAALVLGLLASSATAFFLAPAPLHHHSSPSTWVKDGAVITTRVRYGGMRCVCLYVIHASVCLGKTRVFFGGVLVA